MAETVAPTDRPLYTQRWSIPYHQVPNDMPNTAYGWPNTKAEEYGRVLDCIYEMADQIATSNDIKIEDAIDKACRDQGWIVLPKHKRLLALIWSQPEGPNRIEARINAKHLFSVGTRRGERRFNIEVAAYSRRSAARLAHEHGYMVRDVNMVG